MKKRSVIFPALFILAAGLLGAQTGEPGSGVVRLGRAVAGTAGVSSAVAAAVTQVPREPFIPAEWIGWAYEDRTIPLGNGLFLPSPSDTALLLSAPAIRRDDRVLILGNATAYAAALAGQLAGEVTVMEENHRERDKLAALIASGNPETARLFSNVTLLADWSPAFLSRNRQYSVIIIHGGTNSIPPAILSLLQAPGRLAGILRGESGYSLMFILTRNIDGEGFRTGREIYFPGIDSW